MCSGNQNLRIIASEPEHYITMLTKQSADFSSFVAMIHMESTLAFWCLFPTNLTTATLFFQHKIVLIQRNPIQMRQILSFLFLTNARTTVCGRKLTPITLKMKRMKLFDFATTQTRFCDISFPHFESRVMLF